MQFRCILKSDIYVLEEKHTLSGYGGLWKFPSCQMPLERPEGRVCDNKNGPRFRLQGRARSQHSPWLEEFTMLSCAPFQQSSPTFCDPMACSPPSSSARGVLQERIPEWVAIPSSRGPSWFRDWTYISCVSRIAGRFFTHWTTWEVETGYYVPQIERVGQLVGKKNGGIIKSEEKPPCWNQYLRPTRKDSAVGHEGSF